MRWTTSLSGLLAVAITVLGVAVLPQLVSIRSAQAQNDPDRVSVVQRYLDAVSRGDVDSAAFLFEDNAVFIGTAPYGNCSTSTPCTSLAEIRQQLESIVAVHVCQVLVDATEDGAIVTARTEATQDQIRASGDERIIQAYLIQIPRDKIAFLAAVLDPTDPQTAHQLGVRAGTEPTGPPVTTPTRCAGM
jgi:ketosteroid isomerase-like protein